MDVAIKAFTFAKVYKYIRWKIDETKEVDKVGYT